MGKEHEQIVVSIKDTKGTEHLQSTTYDAGVFIGLTDMPEEGNQEAGTNFQETIVGSFSELTIVKTIDAIVNYTIPTLLKALSPEARKMYQMQTLVSRARGNKKDE